MFKGLAAALAVSLLCAGQALASPIFYATEHLGGDTWRYDYTLGNQTGAPIESFRIYFDFGLYEFELTEVELFPGFTALEVDPGSYAGPANWDIYVAPTDEIFGVPLDGYFDALALGAPHAPGALLGGFSIVFSFLGAGAPGSQYFELLDAFGTNVLGSGFTQRMAIVDVPEPGSAGLLALGLLAAWRFRIRAVHTRMT